MIRFLILFLLSASLAFSQTAPSLYYQFTNPTPLVSTVGGPLTNGGTYFIVPSDVGTALEWRDNNGSYLQAPSLTGSNVTVQFLWKSNYETARGRNATILAWGNLTISFQYPNIEFITPGSNTLITLRGINNFSWDHLMDGQWHHLAFVFSGTSKSLFIDGQKLYTTSCTATSITGQPAISTTVNYAKVRGVIDEWAFYTVALTDRQITQNYLDFQAGNHYTTALAPAYIAGPDSIGVVDTMQLTRNIPRQYQLGKYPGPRYKPGNTLLKNFNWYDPLYMAGAFQPGIGTNQTLISANQNIIQAELANNWNYYYFVKLNETNFINQQAIIQANTNIASGTPKWKFQAITLRGQYPSLINSKTLPKANYLQNSFGQYLNVAGNVPTDTMEKVWRPTAPISSYTGDGTTVNNLLNTCFATFNGSFDMINENGELFPEITDNALTKDPQVVAAYTAAGLTPNIFLSRAFADNETQAYRNIFMANPREVGKKFTEYAIDGMNQFRTFKYVEARKVNTVINGQYYSTGDFYPRWPDNWRYWQSAWHGWQWFVESRVNEIALGDKLYSPFVSAGWDSTEGNNILPPQFNGLLKPLLAMGAEFFYGAFFTLNTAQAPDSKNWIWQASSPSYIQAIGSRIEPYLRTGDVMAGDVPVAYTTTGPGYNFYTGRANTLVTVRKMSGVEKYFIAATIQPISNVGYAPATDTVTFTLAGNPLKINIRRQGSCYIYDKTTTPSTFYQLDTWHEFYHPSRWTTDFNFEAEVVDGGTNTIRTIATGTDYTNFTTYMYGTAQYNFLPRDTATYWLYIRARSTAPAEVVASIGATSQSICIDTTNFAWARYAADSTKAKFALSGLNYTLNIASGTVEIDQIVLSHDSALYVTNYYDCDTVTPPPTCSWVVGSWSAWSSTCVGGYQYRNRTVVSSLPMCTPLEPQPATLDSMSCVCGWITSAWSSFGSCVGGWQFRTRTSVSSMTGCIPPTPQPALVDSQACSCVWVYGIWGPYSACNGVYQVRYRTVSSSVSGCTPIGPAGPASDTLACTIPPPPCTYSVGPWSAWSTCNGVYQTRTRTVTVVPIGCFPGTPAPVSSDTMLCSNTIPAPTNLTVTSKRWYNCSITWTYTGANPDLFQVEFQKTGSTEPPIKQNYIGSARKLTKILKYTTAYTVKMRAQKGAVFSNWSTVQFTTTW